MPTTENNENSHPRAMNKANKARREKELNLMKWLKLGSIILGIIVVLIIIIGVVYEYVYKPNKTLARVENEKVSVSDFQEAVRYQRTNLINNYNYMAQIYQSFGMPMDESTKSSYETQLSAEYSGFMGNQVINSMVNQKVLDFGAKEAGFAVSEEEINQRLESLFGYYPNGTPTAEPTAIPFENTPTISAAQLELLKYTATPLPTEPVSDITSLEEVGPSEPTKIVEPTSTVSVAEENSESSETAPTDESQSPTEVMSPTPSLTPTEYTNEMYQKNLSNQFGNNTYFTKEFFTKQIYYELLQDKVTAALTKDIPTEDDMVWARHILVKTVEEAQNVIDRLKAGEDWSALAAELSQDTSNKDNAGDLGWFMHGAMTEEFDKAAFDQEIGTFSQTPVETSYGFHIIQIIGHEVRPLTSENQKDAISNAYNKWLSAAKEKLNVKIGNDWMDYVPTDPEFSPVL